MYILYVSVCVNQNVFICVCQSGCISVCVNQIVYICVCQSECIFCISLCVSIRMYIFVCVNQNVYLFVCQSECVFCISLCVCQSERSAENYSSLQISVTVMWSKIWPIVCLPDNLHFLTQGIIYDITNFISSCEKLHCSALELHAIHK